MKEFNLDTTKFFVFNIQTKEKVTGNLDYEDAHKKWRELNTDDEGYYLEECLYDIGTYRTDRAMKNKDNIVDPSEKIDGMISETSRVTPRANTE